MSDTNNANETVDQENNTVTEQGTEKTFTQAQVNEIVKKRLEERQNKYSDYDDLKKKAEEYDKLQESNKTELQKATDKADRLQKELDALKKADGVREIRAKVSKETGVPENLLTGETEEDCKTQAEALKTWKDPGYPNLKDGGETGKGGKATTAQQFAEFMEKVF